MDKKYRVITNNLVGPQGLEELLNDGWKIDSTYQHEITVGASYEDHYFAKGEIIFILSKQE
jgi:hypothetical protein